MLVVGCTTHATRSLHKAVTTKRHLLEFAEGTEVTEENFSQIERGVPDQPCKHLGQRSLMACDRKSSKLTYDQSVLRSCGTSAKTLSSWLMTRCRLKLARSGPVPTNPSCSWQRWWSTSTVCINRTQNHLPCTAWRLDATNSGSQILGGMC